MTKAQLFLLGAILLAIISVAIGGWMANKKKDSTLSNSSINVKVNKEISWQDISAEQLAAMLKSKDFLLVDVHIPEQPHIPGTDKFIPFNQIKDRIEELPSERDAKIVLYCRSGSMSRRAAQDLIEMGYTQVYNLDGGVREWVQKGFPLEDIKL